MNTTERSEHHTRPGYLWIRRLRRLHYDDDDIMEMKPLP